MPPQANENVQLSEAGKAKKDLPPTPGLWTECGPENTEFGLLASFRIVREYSSVVLSHHICGTGTAALEY